MKLAEIQDLATAKQALALIEKENERLHARLAKLATENAELRGEGGSKQLEIELLRLKEQMSAMQNTIFGKSSERRAGDRNKDIPKKKRKPKLATQFDLPAVTADHELADDDRACDSCGGQLKEWDGQFEEFEEVDVIEREFRIVRHRRQKYRCSCGCAPVTAPGPLRVRGSKYSLNFAIAVAVDKWGMHLPHVRQSDQMALQGFPVGDAQLWQQSELLARILQDTYDALGEHVAASELVHADETPWPFLRKANKKWWVWTFSNYDSVYMCIDPSRGHEVPKRVLEGSKALLVVDGYSAYSKLVKVCPHMTAVLCWSHVRRKFLDAEKSYPEAGVVLDIIRDLFLIERELPDFRLIADETERINALDVIRETRNEKSRPLIESLETWIREARVLPESSIGGAITYAVNNWKGLRVFLDEPRAPMSNNQAERTLRSPVLGRKNHFGSKTQRGTEVAALFYSLIGTCRMLEINPSDYLRAAAHTALTIPGAILLPYDYRASL